MEHADVIVFEGPWQYYLFKEFIRGKTIIYDAHNCETQLREKSRYRDYVQILEKDLVNNSDIVFSVTQVDLEKLKKFDEKNVEKFQLVPHVLPKKTVEWMGHNTMDISFIGSMYGPNKTALEFILNLCKRMPGFTFHIMGNVKAGIFKKNPKNAIFYGIVSENMKSEILSKSMLALNPVTEGSGRNVKMIDYMMHGVPIISTIIGVRGLENYDLSGKVIISELENFKEHIENCDHNRSQLEILSKGSIELYDRITNKELKKSPYEILENFFENYLNSV